MKVTYPLALVLATVSLLGSSGTLRASETDDRIESSFTKSFVYKTYLKDEHIKINSQDGVVTLSGSVADESHKPMAADTAEALPGVKSVDNQIQITGDRAAENSDGWISMKVKTALLFHSNVNAHKTNVYVKDGIVTLRGEASSQAQKDLTGERVKDVAGVKGIKNELTVAQTSTQPDAKTTDEAIDDASITAQVKGSLLSHRSTSALKTKVETDNGVVTLSGPAKNAAEKDLVTKLTQDINGVKSVVNNMIVDKIATKND
jgi:hyperosmotically inducible periplasmic protein